MGSGTAAFFEPYADDPKTSGLLLQPVRGAGAPDRGGGRGRLPARRARHRRPREQPRARRLREGGRGPTARATAASASSTRRSCASRTSPRYKAPRRDRVHPAVALHRRHALGGEAHRPGAGPRRLQLPLLHRRRHPGRLRHRLVRGAAGPAARASTPRSPASCPAGGPAGRLVPGGEDHPRGRARPVHPRLRLRGVRGDGEGHPRGGTAGRRRRVRRRPVPRPAARDPHHAGRPHHRRAGASSSTRSTAGAR